MSRRGEDEEYIDKEHRTGDRSVEIRGLGTKPVRVFDSLLTVLDVPIRDGLESGKGNVDPLNIHLMDLVSNGVDVNFDLLEEINKKPGEQSVHEDKLIDFRQYVLGITPNYEMKKENRGWLNGLGVSDGLIEDMRREVPECFDKLVETKKKIGLPSVEAITKGEDKNIDKNAELKKVKMVGGFPVELSDKDGSEIFGDEGDWRTTRVLGLDVIQRINYATSDNLVEIPEVNEEGEIIGRRVLKESDLGLDTLEDDKNGEIFKALARHFWKDVALHGSIKENEDGTKEVKVQGDLDVKLSIEVLKMAGIKVDEKEIKFIMPGDERKGLLNVDTSRERVVGKDESGDIKKKFDGVTTVLEQVEVSGQLVWKVTLIVDHHSTTSKSDTSAAKQLYVGLYKLGLIEKVDPIFEKLIDFSTYEDNGTPPKEMSEVLREYREKNVGSVMGLREFFIKKWPFSAWVHRKKIHIKNYLDFIKLGGDFTEILDKRSEKFKSLGLIYKKQNGQSVDLLSQSQEHMLNALVELQNIEQNNGVLEIEGVGKIVFDDGAKMRGLGSQICRDLGYDGYISYDFEKKSFMVWTKDPLDVEYSQGFKLRQHMWVTKPVEGELLSEADVISALIGDRQSKWTSGLYVEQKLDDLESYRKVKKEVVNSEKEKGFWNQKMYKKLVVGGFTPTTEAGKAALKSLNEVGIDLLEIIKNGKEVSKLADAAYTAYKKKTFSQNQFQTVEEAENFIKEYFSYLNISDEELNKNEQNTKEPQFYDELYLDLWNSEYGDGDEKIKSQERLTRNNILPVEFGADDVAKETYRMALEAIRNNKFVAWHDKKELTEAHIKKIHGIKENAGDEKKENTAPAVETVEINKNIEYLDYLGNDLLVDLDRVYAGKDEKGKWKYKESMSKAAIDRMTKMGLRLVMMPRKGDKGEIPHFIRGQRAMERISDFLDGKEVNREELNYFNSDLRAMGIKKEDLEEARRRKLEKDKRKGQVDGEKDDKKSVEDISLSEDEVKNTQERYRKMTKQDLLEAFDTLVEAGGNKVVWGDWKQTLSSMSGQDLEGVLDQLRSSLMLLENTPLRLKYFDYWKDYGTRILGDLKIAI